jgi:mRNA interferase RelE/StbE
LSEAKARLSEIADEVGRTHERVHITRNGREYVVLLACTSARQLTEHLPETVAAVCVEFLYGPLAENPSRVGAPLRKPFEAYWRVCRGEYRVRYTIDDNTQTVQVLDVSHRRDVYRWLRHLQPVSPAGRRDTEPGGTPGCSTLFGHGTLVANKWQVCMMVPEFADEVLSAECTATVLAMDVLTTSCCAVFVACHRMLTRS